MIAALDTNVLLDVLLKDEANCLASKERLDRAHSEGGLVICEIVYAELMCQFGDVAPVHSLLDRTGIRLVPSSLTAVQKAGLAWQRYIQRRKEGLQCPSCGALSRPCCPKCGREIGRRQHIVSDFLIGAHASV